MTLSLDDVVDALGVTLSTQDDAKLRRRNPARIAKRMLDAVPDDRSFKPALSKELNKWASDIFFAAPETWAHSAWGRLGAIFERYTHLYQAQPWCAQLVGILQGNQEEESDFT